MSSSRGWNIPEQHLLPDAVVAFVDGELSAVAHSRAAAHLARCPLCAAETASQRQAQAAVRAAEAPGMPAGLLAALQSIPVDTDLPPSGPDHLAVTADGQLVAVQRPDRVAGLGASAVIGSSRPLGSGDAVLRVRPHGRRAVQGAGVVAAGLVLGVMAAVGPQMFGDASTTPKGPTHGDGPTDPGIIQANFGGTGGATSVTLARTPAWTTNTTTSMPVDSASSVPRVTPAPEGH